jgi:aminoglycoside 6'-N-acetyltransferase I
MKMGDPGDIRIGELDPAERAAWRSLRAGLWPETPKDERDSEEDLILGDPRRNAVFVARLTGGKLVGFVEAALRDWAEGCCTRPVGYVEGWYVESEHRRRGIGRRLVEAAEQWARSLGCTEMGSDAEIANTLSHRAHAALGYEEVERVVSFAKRLVP